jgi:hypothetical protein
MCQFAVQFNNLGNCRPRLILVSLFYRMNAGEPRQRHADFKRQPEQVADGEADRWWTFDELLSTG